MIFSNSRRRVLLGLATAGAAGALGLFSRSGLASLALRGTRDDVPRLKIVFVTSPDGLGVDEFQGAGQWNGNGIWHPKTALDISRDFDTGEFELNEASSLLEPYRDRSLYLRGGIANFDDYDNPNTGHAGYVNTLRDSKMAYASIDLLIAQHFGELLMYSGPHTRIGNAWFNTWSGAGKDNSAMPIPEADPSVLFEDVFGRSRGARIPRPLSASIFDPVIEDMKQMQGLVGGSERTKFDVHLDAIHQVVKAINEGGGSIGCEPIPPEMGGIDISGSADKSKVADMHMDVVAAALSCGQRRVASVQISASTETLNLPDIDSPRNPHDLAHWGLFGADSSLTSRGEWLRSRQWYVKRVGHLLEELEKYPDPDVPGDSLMDHTLVIYTSEMADGYKEHKMDMPLVFFGGKHTPLSMPHAHGRYLNVIEQGEVDWKNQAGWTPRALSMERVWVSLAASIGFEAPYPRNEPVRGLFKTPSYRHA